MREELTHDTSARQKPEAENGTGGREYFRDAAPPRDGFVLVLNAALRDPRLNTTDAAVLAYLAYYGLYRTSGDVSDALLAELLQVHRSNVWRARTKLRRLGLLDDDFWPVANVEDALRPDAPTNGGTTQLSHAETKRLGSAELAIAAQVARDLKSARFMTVERDGESYYLRARLYAKLLGCCVRTALRRLYGLAGSVLGIGRSKGHPARVRVLSEREQVAPAPPPDKKRPTLPPRREPNYEPPGHDVLGLPAWWPTAAARGP